jgi:hypothetical protein
VRAALLAAFIFLTVSGCCGEPPHSPSTSASASPSAPATPPPPPETPAGADARALLDGLDLGAVLGDAKVIGIWGPRGSDATLRVQVERPGGNTFMIGIMRRRDDPKDRRPPVATQGYELGFGEAQPDGSGVPPDAAMASLKAVEERIRRTEARVPVPDGL